MINFQQFVGSITNESVRKQVYRKQVNVGQECHNVPSERQTSDEHMTEGGQVDTTGVTTKRQQCHTDVPVESPVIDNNLPQEGQKNDNEVTSDGQDKPFLPLLFGQLPRDGEPPENPIQPTKLQKPKIRKPKKQTPDKKESEAPEPKPSVEE